MTSQNATVLWTGGKDSSLAFYEARLLGYQIPNLVTFVPPDEPRFFAHPIDLMKYQARAMGIPHHTIDLKEPYRQSYEDVINFLKDRYGISTLVTGDIAEVDGYPNWTRECAVRSGVEVLTPLWGRNRLELVGKLLAYNFNVIFSCVKKPWFTEDWLGTELNEDSLRKLRTLSADTGLDICGENGEYHTMTLDGPMFRKRVLIEEYSRESKDPILYMDVKRLALEDK